MYNQDHQLSNKYCIEHTENVNKETDISSCFLASVKCGFFLFLYKNVYLFHFLDKVGFKVTNFYKGGLYNEI